MTATEIAKSTRPVLRYHGGKWRLAPWLISFFPPHRVYVEPFGGGASVLMRKKRSYAEIYNDLDAEVVNIFRVLRDPAQAMCLAELLRLTPFAREEFEQCGSAHVAELTDPIERARRTIFRSFAGFGSAATNADFATGFRANSNRSGSTPAHDWMNYPNQIAAFTARLRGVVIENRAAADVITQHDGPDTLHYVDPPYPHETRNMRRGNASYRYEMDTADHVALAETLHAARGMVIVSGYSCDLYDCDLYSEWKRYERDAHADGARDRIEVIWMNKMAADKLHRKQMVLV